MVGSEFTTCGFNFKSANNVGYANNDSLNGSAIFYFYFFAENCVAATVRSVIVLLTRATCNPKYIIFTVL